MTLWKLKSLDKKSGNGNHFNANIHYSYFVCIFYSLTLTNIEEQVVASNLVHEANCIISIPEFALRLQISVDNPITTELFRIFDTVSNFNQEKYKTNFFAPYA